MREIEVRQGDIVTFRSGSRSSVSVFVEEVDYERSTPNGWRVKGPRVGKNGHVWERDMDRNPHGWFHVHPTLIASLGEGIINEYDDDTGLSIVWSPTDASYAVKQGEHRYVCLTTTFAEAREAVRSYQ